MLNSREQASDSPEASDDRLRAEHPPVPLPPRPRHEDPLDGLVPTLLRF